jgi:hypothetical protein
MARTGRFGRSLREAPDLTSAIVSMMRQYRAQQDQNIFDAWENGGEYEGRKVTDAMLLDHIRSRRDELDKDDPLWDEWNNRLWQYRFSIAEQKANLKYQRALASAAHINTSTRAGAAAYANAQAAASAMMRGFYTQWASRLPRRSAAYRDLMASAAQYARAAALSQQRARSATQKPDEGPSDYERYVARVEAVEREYVMPMKTVAAALNAFAAARGLIPEGGDILRMAPGEASLLWESLAAGVENDPSWPYLKRKLQKLLPDGMFHGSLTLDLLERLSTRAQQGVRMQVEAARQYPGDLRSHIASFREDGRLARAYKSLDTRLSAGDDVMDGYNAYQEAIMAAEDPLDWTGADKQAFVRDLQRAYDKYMKAEDYVAAGATMASIKALYGDTSTSRVTGAMPVWGGNVSLEQVAATEAQMSQWAQGIRAGGMYVVRAPASSVDGISASNERGFTVHSFVEEPLVSGQMALVPQLASDGTIVPVAVPLAPVYAQPGAQEPELYVAEVDGQRLFVRYLSRADGTVVPSWTGDTALRSTGMVLKPEGNGYVMVNQSDASITRIREVFETQYPPAVPPTPEEQAVESGYVADVDAARVERLGLLREQGIMQVGNTYTTLNGEPVPQSVIDLAVQNIDQRIEARYGQEGVAGVAGVTSPVEALLPGSTGPEAYAAQQGLAFNTPYLSSPSSVVAYVMENPTLVEQYAGRETQLLDVVAQEPGMVGMNYNDAYGSLTGLFDRHRLSAEEAAAAAEGSANPRIGAGILDGAAWSTRLDWAPWDRMAIALGETNTEADRLSQAGRGVVDSAQQVLTTAGGIASGVLNMLNSIGRALDSPSELPGPPERERMDAPIQPRVKLPNIPGFGTVEQGSSIGAVPPPSGAPAAPNVQVPRPPVQPQQQFWTRGGNIPAPTTSGRSRGGSYGPRESNAPSFGGTPSSTSPLPQQPPPNAPSFGGVPSAGGRARGGSWGEEEEEDWNPRGGVRPV